jgi:SAM-dependent methyltransferase
MQIKKHITIDNSLSWNEYASEYNCCSIFDENLIHPGLGLSGIKPDEIYNGIGNLLDVGCGSGLNTFIFAKHAQGMVIGIDAAETMIKEAKKKYILPNLCFYNRDFLKPSEIVEKKISFACVTFIGSLDYIELNDAFFYILNSMTSAGSICFITKFHSFWTTLFDNDTHDMNIKSYFDFGRKDNILYGMNKRHNLARFHYSLSGIFSLFNINGWRLCKFEEPAPDLEHSAFSYAGYKEDTVMVDRLSKIPMTMVLNFVREA